MVREFTGWHMLAITVSAFAVIIAVNVGMAWKAISTFPGLVVTSSYLASQDFDAEKAAQLALGWTLTPDHDAASGAIRLAFTDASGKPVTLKDLTVLIGRPTEAKDDRTPTFLQGADGAYAAREDLAQGKWILQVTAHAMDGTLFRQRLSFTVKG
jgi:nitrogen fixation protein FixH